MKFLRWRDCSVSLFILTMLTSKKVTEILGAPDIYIEEGVTMNLTCMVRLGHFKHHAGCFYGQVRPFYRSYNISIRDSPEPPQFIFWKHNDKVTSWILLLVLVFELLCSCLMLSFDVHTFIYETQAISYDSPRGGVSQITEKGETTASFLLIQVRGSLTESWDSQSGKF